MKNNFFTLLTGGIMLSALALTFSSCEDDYEPVYKSYGLVNKLEDNKFSISLDNGQLVYPQECSARWDDSTRLFIGFNILSEQDLSTDIRLVYVDTILTKPILTYKESILDSMGNDPIRITGKWFAHGFLNLEFTYYGRHGLSSEHMHMVNLLQHPDDKLVFELRHNDFDDYKEQIYRGRVSFPIANILEGMEKPVEITLKYKNSSTSDHSEKLEYK